MASYKALLLLFSLFLITFAHEHLDEEYTCSHDDQDHEPLFADVDEDMSAVNSTVPDSNEDYDEDHNARMLASSRYRSIRMYPYFGFLEQSASSSFVRYVQNELVPPVISYFEAALKVKYPISGNLRLSSSARRVCERPTPSILRRGVSADYFIYFDSFADSSSQVANSKYCYLSSGSRRPIVTRTRFNRNMFRDARGNVLVHEKNTYLLIHEMLHTLGFSGSMYKYFVDSNGRTRRGHLKSVSIAGKTRQVLDVPPLTQRLRNFYGCSSLPGAILENQGGSGTSSSHFERKYFVYETMSSGGIYGRRVSEFSLALLEGSGWYVVNYDYAEPFFYGKGQGCSFISGKCSSSRAYFDEYCTGSSRGCAPHGRSGGKCRSDSISDGCRYYYPDVDYDCDNSDAEDYTRLPQLQVFGRGAESKCFTGDLNSRRSSSRTSFCFKYACSGSGSNTELEVYVGNHRVTCTREGKRSVDGYYGSIDCPDPETFCQGAGKKYCPRGCMGRGTCVNNKCHCRSGYKGIDCGLRS